MLKGFVEDDAITGTVDGVVSDGGVIGIATDCAVEDAAIAEVAEGVGEDDQLIGIVGSDSRAGVLNSGVLQAHPLGVDRNADALPGTGRLRSG